VTDDELVRAFEGLTLPAAQFHHREHVLVAFRYLQAGSLLEALPRFTAALRRFAEANGVGHIYHETVTWAFLVLMNERLERMGRATTWQAFVDGNPDLLRKDCLAAHYSRDALASPLARRVFLLPNGIGGAGPPGHLTPGRGNEHG
jgi:hypothetical protein